MSAQESRAGSKTGQKRVGARRMSAGMRQFISILCLILIIGLWQGLAVLIGKNYLLPAPSRILSSLWENRADLFLVHFPATMKVVFAGGFLAVLIGAVFAVIMDWSDWAKRALYPILTITQTVPVMCIAPVFVLWFGYTFKMRVLVVILVNFFSVTVNLYDGFASTRLQRTELMQTYGATRMQMFTMLRMPTALPYFFTALRIAAPWSVIGAAVSEWLGAPNGLGTYSRSCMMNLDAAGLIAPLLILTAAALIMNSLISALEKRIVSWNGD